jgi:polysaccharide export outer membrane protein
MHRRHIAVPFLAAMLLAAAGAAGAQEIPPPGTSPEQIQQQIDALGLRERLLDRMQESGMTPDQIRQELARRGYDPSVLDPYLDEAVTRPPEPSSNVLSAVQALGVLQPTMPDSLTAAMDSLLADSLAERPMPDSIAIERERELRVFGLEMFNRNTTEFQPVSAGPVPPGYVIGPGDELVLILTGDVEASYRLPVTREGFIVIPQVGQVWVNGLTLQEVRDQMYTHLGRAYSGIGRGPEASTHFQLSLGQLRPNQVFVSGEVLQPGSYVVSSVASVLNALYHGGGPSPSGSFRDVRVMRQGELAQRVDLYGYLVQGDNLADIQLQPGDVVFVPSHRGHVSIRGEVVRPAIYEVLPDETLLDLVQFAGGLNAPAHLRRARITRILPPEERTVPGMDRTVMDVDLAELVRDPGAAPALRPGDAVEIFPIRSEVRNTVTVQGAVWHEGTFQFRPGLRVWDLIDLADGLKEDAYAQRAQIVRIDPSDSTMSLIPVSLERAPDGTPVDNPELREFDSVRVFAESRFTTLFPVTITGEVREPVQDTFYEGMTLKDLILKAGGLRPTADLEIEIARLADPSRTDRNQIAEVIRVTVDSSYFVSDQDQRFYLGGQVPDNGPAADFLLRPYDRVMVRPLPDLEFHRSVAFAGQVRYPGSYTLERKDERLLTLLERAGGLTTTAYPGGFQLYRDSTLVNVDLQAALADPTSTQNIVLLPGDSMFVPEYNPVVLVRGAINSPTPVAVLYREGAGLEYYIQNAGGYARFADTDNVNIRFANGEGATVDRVLLFRRRPEPLPGSVVTVPSIPADERIRWTEAIGDLAQVAGALTTLLILLSRL